MAAADYMSARSPAPRPRLPHANLSQGPGTPGSPHTPLLSRSISSQYGSPGVYRADDELVVYDIGSRFLRAGFSSEAAPRVIWHFGPENHRRAGDYGPLTGHESSHSNAGRDHVGDWELWDYDIANLNLDLVEDKLERAFRTIAEKHLMLDLKSRSAILALPSCLPNPLAELVLKTIFKGVNQPRSIYLMSSSIASVVAAGLRSGLVVDIGWHETTVTAVYEYREILQRRTIRATKMLCYATSKMLVKSTSRKPSFAVTEDVTSRLTWCYPSGNDTEVESAATRQIDLEDGTKIPAADAATPVEKTFLQVESKIKRSDDHDRPLQDMIWRSLLALPFDVRSICVSRIIFTGGGSQIPGLKERLLREVKSLVDRKGWSQVLSDHPAKKIVKKPLRTGGSSRSSSDKGGVQLGPTTDPRSDMTDDKNVQRATGAGSPFFEKEPDEITEKLEKAALRARPSLVQAEVRGVETMGAWAGASLMGHLRVEGSIEIKKDDFVKNGMNILGYPI